MLLILTTSAFLRRQTELMTKESCFHLEKGTLSSSSSSSYSSLKLSAKLSGNSFKVESFVFGGMYPLHRIDSLFLRDKCSRMLLLHGDRGVKWLWWLLLYLCKKIYVWTISKLYLRLAEVIDSPNFGWSLYSSRSTEITKLFSWLIFFFRSQFNYWTWKGE